MQGHCSASTARALDTAAASTLLRLMAKDVSYLATLQHNTASVRAHMLIYGGIVYHTGAACQQPRQDPASAAAAAELTQRGTSPL